VKAPQIKDKLYSALHFFFYLFRPQLNMSVKYLRTLKECSSNTSNKIVTAEDFKLSICWNDVADLCWGVSSQFTSCDC